MLPDPRAPIPAARRLALAAVAAAALLLIFPAARSHAATTTLNPSADAYVDSSSAGTNYGTLTKLRTDGSPIVKSYLRFHVAGLTGPVTKATLRVTPASNLSGGIDARAVANTTWGESTITNSNAPATGSVLGTASGITSGQPVSFTVTPSVTGNGDYSFALTSSSVTALALWSREAGASLSPQLIVETQDPPPTDTTPPAAPTGLTATAGNASVAVDWANNAESDLAGYRVYRRNADGTWPTTPTATVTASQWSDSGRTNGTTYTYRVTAYDTSGNESQPSATASATPTAPPPTDTQPTLPVRAAFFYPWFPESWNQQGMNPFTKYHPTSGFYDSSNTSVIQQQVRAMDYGNVGVSIASWWGQGTPTDSRIPTLLNTTTAMGSKLRWSLYYEAEGTGNPTVSQITSDLAYIRDHYGSDPSYFRVNGRFVVFVYADGSDACSMADRWKQANTMINAYIVLKVFSGYKTCLNQPDGWHQYSPAVAADSQAGYSYSISPGFNKANEASPRLARDLTRWNQNVRDMVASKAPFQLVTTFDEWGEGTSVESATEWSSASGFGQYVDALHNNGQTAPPPPDTTAPAAPTGLGATAGNASVALDWANNTESDLAGYRVYRQNADGTWPTTPTAIVTASQWSDSGRTNGTSYTYRVTAYDTSGNESQPSATASATPTAPPPDTTAPAAPTGLTATAGNASVALDWANNTESDLAGYRVYRQNADGTWPTTPTATVTASQWSDSGLTNGTSYTYRVTAYDNSGNESQPSATASATPTAPASGGPCGTTTSHPATWQHVVWVIMENHASSQIIGSSSAPYINSLANGCGLATNYKAITHPSLPNYVAMTSGSPQGITDDNPPSSHPLNVPSIFSQLPGGQSRSLQESMPSNCLLSNSGTYAVKHNPEAYYTNIRTDCSSYDVPLGTTPDISAKFTFVTPNLCNDMHDCSVTTGDNWLKGFIPKLTSSPQYQAGNTAIVLTWDEDDMTSVNQVATVVISPGTAPGTKSGTAFNHYSLLRSTEEMLGINSFLGGAATATSMRSAFNL